LHFSFYRKVASGIVAPEIAVVTNAVWHQFDQELVSAVAVVLLEHL
jgi:hypothetical protein